MLNIFYSQTLKGCETEIFLNLKLNRNSTIKHVVFVPDRMALQMEQKLFSYLNVDCFFDINVSTLTRFTENILKTNNFNFKVLTKPLGVALIKKILNENENNFLTFKKSIKFNGFASNLFDTISMFKSCNVQPKDLLMETKSKSLNEKMKDISLIYQEYENFLGNIWTDSFNKLNLLSTLLNKENCKNTYFYFVGFDDFTPQMYNIIAKLSVFAPQVNVATAVGYIDRINNKNIYSNNVYLNLLSLANTYSIKITKKYCALNLEQPYQFLADNLFSYNTSKKIENNNKIKCLKFDNTIDEINFVAKSVLNLIKKGYKFSDFAILVPDLQVYKNNIINIFDQNSIDYFIDESDSIMNNIIVRFYNDLFLLVNNNYEKDDFINFIKSYTCSTMQEQINLQNFIELSGKNYKELLELKNDNFINLSQKIFELKSLHEKLNKVSNFSQLIELLITFTNNFGFNDYINDLNKKYNLENDILNNRHLSQTLKKVNEGLDLLNSVLGDYKSTTSNYFSIIKSYFECVNIVIPPIIENSIFIGDVLQSTITDKDFIFIMGCADGNVPIVQSDLGLISDNDIDLLEKGVKLTPTINMINKRNKFKIYETILNFRNIYLSYVGVDSNGEIVLPCEVIKNITTFFEPKVNIIDGSKLQNIINYGLDENNLLFNNPSMYFLEQNLLNGIKNNELFYDDETYVNNVSILYNNAITNTKLKSLINNNEFKNDIENIKDTTNLFLKNNFISISQFEKYFNCPYKYFVEYGLRLKDGDSSNFGANIIGNILHEYAKEIVPFIQDNINNENIKKESDVFGKKILAQILSEQQYYYLVNNNYNKHSIKSLYSEIKRINDVLINISTYSKFKTNKNLLEMPFIESNMLKVGNLKIQIKGVIDRVDYCDDEVRIIDYKTGNTKFKDFTDVYSGNKIQLIVYLYVIAKNEHKKVAGAFYLPLKNDFSKDETITNKLEGIVKNNLATIINLDNNLLSESSKSEILNLKRNKDGEVKGSLLLNESDFQTLFEYVKNIMNKALVKIKNGNIKAEPLKLKETACKYCKYKGMCKFDESLSNNYRVVEKVETIDKFKESNNEI